MERAHYRRVTQTRYADGSAASNETGFKERIILQAIVSGLVLTAVLLMCLVDNSITSRLKRNLSQALSNQPSLESVMAEVEKISRTLTGAPPEEAAAYEPPVVDVPISEAPLKDTSVAETPVEANNGVLSDGLRIDEDVLTGLDGAFTASDDSKSTVPEPSTFPEP